MGHVRQRWAWRRYRRGLRTIPVIVIGSVVVWALSGGGYFWPAWVLLWGGFAMGFRARRAMRLGRPDELRAVTPEG